MADNYLCLRTLLRVGDLDRSVGFCCDLFGMVELRRRDVLEGRCILSFVGNADRPGQIELELAYN